MPSHHVPNPNPDAEPDPEAARRRGPDGRYGREPDRPAPPPTSARPPLVHARDLPDLRLTAEDRAVGLGPAGVAQARAALAASRPRIATPAEPEA